MLLFEAGVFDGRRTDTDEQAREGRQALVFARDDADLRTVAGPVGVRPGGACASGGGRGSLSVVRGDALGCACGCGCAARAGSDGRGACGCARCARCGAGLALHAL